MPGNLGSLPTLAIIATWPTPNYEHPHAQRTWLVPFSIVLLVLVTIMVAVRIYTRARSLAGPIGVDDMILIPGYLMTIPFTIFCCIGVLYDGIDRHIYDVPPSHWSKAALVAWLSFFFFLVSTACTKVSVLLFYRRLSKAVVSPAWKHATIVAIWFTVVSTLLFILLLIFTCNPTEAYWEAYDPGYSRPYHCVDTRPGNVVAGVFSTVSDLYSVILPIGMIRQIEATRRQKIALNVVFAAGLLIVAIASVRTYSLFKFSYSHDPTWQGYETFFWGLLEMQLALIVASAPALRVFFRRYLARTSHEKTENASHHKAGPHGKFSAHAGPQSRAMKSYISLNSVTEPAHLRRESSDEKSLVQHLARPLLDPVEEYKLPPRVASAAQPRQIPVRTPADFEAFALYELEKTRLAKRAAGNGDAPSPPPLAKPNPDPTAPEVVQMNQRHLHDSAVQRPQSMKSTLSGPFEDPFRNPYPT